MVFDAPSVHRRRSTRTSTSSRAIPASVRAKAYDLVLNGAKSAAAASESTTPRCRRASSGGSGITDEEAKLRFGFFLEALEYGTPPHGGIALGLDRIVAILAGEASIREVIAFPKTANAVDLMAGRAVAGRRQTVAGAAFTAGNEAYNRAKCCNKEILDEAHHRPRRGDRNAVRLLRREPQAPRIALQRPHPHAGPRSAGRRRVARTSTRSTASSASCRR